MSDSAITDGTISPVRDSDRFRVMDVLRGFALCGILLMNIPAMGLLSHVWHPPLPAELTPSWMVWWAEGLFFEGTMRGLFTLLFGAGLVFMTLRGDREHGSVQVADVWYRRSLLLLLLGALNFTLLGWFGDILYAYGLAALFLFPFRRLKPVILCGLAAVLIAFLSISGGFDARASAERWAEGEAAVAAQTRGETLTEKQVDQAEGHEERLENRNPPAEQVAEERESRTSYLSAVGFSVSEWADWGLSEGMIYLVIESIAVMFIGVALFKWGVLTGQRSTTFYVIMAVIGYACGIGINAAERLADWNSGFLPTLWWPGFTYELGRLPLTLAHLALVILLFRANALGFVGKGLEAIGKTALTNYLGQSLIALIIFNLLGWFDHFDLAQLWGIAVGVWVTQGILSVIWLRRFSMGPVEWLLRCASYGKWQPIVRRDRQMRTDAPPRA